MGEAANIALALHLNSSKEKRLPQMACEEGSRPKQNFKLKDYKKELRCKI